MSSNLKVNTVLPSVGTALGIGTAGGSVSITSDTITALTGGSEKVRITSGGLVGIGTNNPTQNLDILGSSTSSVLVRASTLNGTAKLQLQDILGRDNFIAAEGADNLVFAADEGNAGGDSYMRFKVDGSEKLRIDSSGRVLINTTNNSNGHISASKLAVQGADLSIFKDSGGDNAGVSGHKLKFITQSGSLGEIDVLSEGGGGPNGRGGAMRFYTKANNTASATERLRIDSNGHVLPAANNTYDLGSTTLGWRNVYMNDLNLSNMKGDTNDVDGTQGSWTIQEGKDDLYIINRLNGKKFKIKMEEIL